MRTNTLILSLLTACAVDSRGATTIDEQTIQTQTTQSVAVVNTPLVSVLNTSRPLTMQQDWGYPAGYLGDSTHTAFTVPAGKMFVLEHVYCGMSGGAGYHAACSVVGPTVGGATAATAQFSFPAPQNGAPTPAGWATYQSSQQTKIYFGAGQISTRSDYVPRQLI